MPTFAPLRTILVIRSKTGGVHLFVLRDRRVRGGAGASERAKGRDVKIWVVATEDGTSISSRAGASMNRIRLVAGSRARQGESMFAWIALPALRPHRVTEHQATEHATASTRNRKEAWYDDRVARSPSLGRRQSRGSGGTPASLL